MQRPSRAALPSEARPGPSPAVCCVQSVKANASAVCCRNRPYFAAVTSLSTTDDVLPPRDENGSDTDRYHRYYICFHISVRIRIRIRIVSTMSDRIRLDIDIINMRFEYSDTDTVSDVGYPDSDTDRSQPL